MSPTAASFFMLGTGVTSGLEQEGEPADFMREQSVDDGQREAD